MLLEKILRTVCLYGARVAKPGEFTYRAFINNKIDLLQAESINNLINSQTISAAKASQRSLKGDFSKVINDIINSLIKLRMYIESSIDFVEENIDFIAHDKISKSLLKIINQLNKIFEIIKFEENINREIKVVITGKPNVGKSTVLNMLSKNKVAIVTKYAGTTRDLVKSKININGILLEVVDTAGIHRSDNLIENYGIEIAKKEISKSDLIIKIICLDKEVNKKLYCESLLSKKKQTEILVVNKIDLLKQEEISFLKNINDLILISAAKNLGLVNLVKKINILLKKNHSTENNFLARKRHLLALRKSLKHLKQCYNIKKKNMQFDFLANELYLSQLSLEEVTGKFTCDDLLGKIFSEFCIGK